MGFKEKPSFMVLSEKNFWIVEVLNERKGQRVSYGTRRAAVLILIYERDGELYIVFTKRTDNLMHHKGQISFPGGACEDDDASLEATALRETFEEVGIKPEDVRILGILDDFESRSSGYVVTPVVGLIPSSHSFTLNREEVERVIEVPVMALSEKEGMNGGEYLYETDLIWGLTARILKQFLDLRA